MPGTRSKASQGEWGHGHQKIFYYYHFVRLHGSNYILNHILTHKDKYS